MEDVCEGVSHEGSLKKSMFEQTFCLTRSIESTIINYQLSIFHLSNSRFSEKSPSSSQ